MSGMSSKLMDKIKAKRKDIQAKSGQREDLLKVPTGKHKFRILPAKPEKGEDAEFWADFGQHFVKSEEKNERGNYKVKSVYVCVDKTFGKECPICESIEQLIPQATTDEQLDILDESKCRRAEVLVNALHLTGDKPSTPQILQLTPTTFENILGMMDEYGDITDLSEGVDLIIERSGSGLNTKYQVMPAAKSKKVDSSVLEQMADLEEFVQQEHEDNLKRAISALNGTVGILTDAAPKALTTTATTTATSTAVETSADDDDMMDIMEADFEEVEEKEVAAKKVAGSDVTASSDDVMSDDDDLDALLADLDDL